MIEFGFERVLDESKPSAFPDVIHEFRVEYLNAFQRQYATAIVGELSSDDERAELLRIVTHLKEALEAPRHKGNPSGSPH